MDQYDSFVVRVWRRDGADGMQWAGRLEHVQGHESWRCSDLDGLLALLRTMIGRVDGSGLVEPTTGESAGGR